MRHLTFAIAAVGLLIASPVLAQDAARVPTAQAAVPAAPTADEIAAAGDAFYASLDTMRAEILEAKAAAGDDTARAVADADAIEATYQARADAFAATLRAFLAANPGMVKPEDADQEQTQIKQSPALVRRFAMNDQEEAEPEATEPADATAN
jgi:hypothetical protein